MYCSIAAEGWLAWLLLAFVVQAFHVTLPSLLVARLALAAVAGWSAARAEEVPPVIVNNPTLRCV